MSEQTETVERHDRTVRAWLLAVLRFAVTRDNDDRLAALAAASEIDKSSTPHGRLAGFRFFHRTSAELCAAIAGPAGLGRAAILHRHLERMTEERMRRAFAAALEPDQVNEPPRKTASVGGRSGLWRGLASGRFHGE